MKQSAYQAYRRKRLSVEPLPAPPPLAANATDMDKAKHAGRLAIHRNGIAAFKELLNEFGVASVTELEQSQLGDFIQACHRI